MASNRLSSLLRVSAPFTLLSLVNIALILPSHLAKLGATPLLLGAVYSAGTVVRLTARLASGFVSRRIGYRKLLVASFAARAVSYAMFAASRRLEVSAVALLLLRASIGIESPAYLSMIALASGAKPATGFGLALSARRAPAIAAPLLTGLVASWLGTEAVFAVASLLSLASIPLIVKLKEERGAGDDVELKSLVNRDFALLMASAFTLFVSVSGFQPFFYLWMTEGLGFSYAALGGLAALGEGLAFFSRVYSGALAERLGYAVGYALVGVLRSSLLAAVALSANVAIAVIAYLGLRGLVAAPSRNALVSKMVPREAYGAAYALVGLAIDAGSIVGPLLTGAVVDAWGPQAGFAVLSAVYAIFALQAISLRTVKALS